jgi:hypothetical protein
MANLDNYNTNYRYPELVYIIVERNININNINSQSLAMNLDMYINEMINDRIGAE